VWLIFDVRLRKMPVRMRIEYVSPERVGRVVLARQLESKGFRVTATSRLGGVPIEPVLSQPRAIKPDGRPDLEIFAFQLKSAADLSKFSLGSEVVLEEEFGDSPKA
jgi:hypothetical protein